MAERSKIKRLYFFALIRLQKGDEMSVVSKVPGFPYYLWTTSDGKCWVRIIDTNEVTEVSREVMRELRKEEKRMRRLQETIAQRQRQDDTFTDTEECMDDSSIIENEQQGDSETGVDTNWYEIHHALPLYGEWKGLEVSSWSMDPYDIEEEAAMRDLEQRLIESLSPRQKDCYICCVIKGEGKFEYAKRNGITAQRVNTIFSQIKQKLKKLI